MLTKDEKRKMGRVTADSDKGWMEMAAIYDKIKDLYHSLKKDYLPLTDEQRTLAALCVVHLQHELLYRKLISLDDGLPPFPKSRRKKRK